MCIYVRKKQKYKSGSTGFVFFNVKWNEKIEIFCSPVLKKKKIKRNVTKASTANV